MRKTEKLESEIAANLRAHGKHKYADMLSPPSNNRRVRARLSHASKADPREQFVALLIQRSYDAREIARDLLIEHGVLKTGKVDSIVPVADASSGKIFQVGIVLHGDDGGRPGSNDPKRFWMAAPTDGEEVPFKGSVVDFVSRKADPPTGKSAFSPKHELLVVDPYRGIGSHTGSYPESLIRKWATEWTAKWWP